MNTTEWLFIVLFIIHEAEEVWIIPAWLKKNTHLLKKHLPKFCLPLLGISRGHFSLIALEELALIVLITCLWGETAWWFGMVAVYTIHLFIHCLQFILAYNKQFILWSVPVEIPVCLVILILNRHIAAPGQLYLATGVLFLLMVFNLALMHILCLTLNRKK